MASFVLVHGAWHGGWCWEKTLTALRAAGHSAVAPDLPGHGDDPTAHSDVDFAAYCDRVCDVIDSLPGEQVLVGHSLGGFTISQVAEHRSDRLRSLVYLAAFLPHPDECIELAALTGHASDGLRAGSRISDDGHSICFDPACAREVFYGDCSDEDVVLARQRICPQPQQVFGARLSLSAAGFGSVPRDYIVCLQDNAVPADAQQEMLERAGCRAVYTLDRSHSPFFSAPEVLAKILGEIADA